MPEPEFTDKIITTYGGLFRVVFLREDLTQSDGDGVSSTKLQGYSRHGQARKQRIEKKKWQEEAEELTSICAFDNLHPVA